MIQPIMPEEAREMGKLFSSLRGQKVLKTLDRIYLNAMSFDANNVHMTSFREGRRSVVLMFHQTATAMKKEAANEIQEEADSV